MWTTDWACCDLTVRLSAHANPSVSRQHHFLQRVAPLDEPWLIAVKRWKSHIREASPTCSFHYQAQATGFGAEPQRELNLVHLENWTATVAETARFEAGTQIWRTRTEDSLDIGGGLLHRWNIRLMPNISYAVCSGLSRMVSVQFTLKMCITAWNREKITINPYFGVQGHWRWYQRKGRQQCLLW